MRAEDYILKLTTTNNNNIKIITLTLRNSIAVKSNNYFMIFVKVKTPMILILFKYFANTLIHSFIHTIVYTLKHTQRIIRHASAFN
jgi:hypothetical protein